MSSHFLNNEKGRHKYISRNMKLCDQSDIEDKFHFILKCPHYLHLRIRYIKRFYYTKHWLSCYVLITQKSLKQKTSHKCFLPLLKAELNAMLHRIQISTNTCEVTMQVKRAIRKVTLQKLPIYNDFMCLQIILNDFFFCFPIVVKALLHGFDSYI